MTEDDVRMLAERVLKPMLAPVGFVSSDVEAKPDQSGDDALYVTVHFAAGSPIASGKILIDAGVALHDALTTEGDPRFPYFRYDYPDDPAPFDEFEAYGVTDAAVS